MTARGRITTTVDLSAADARLLWQTALRERLPLATMLRRALVDFGDARDVRLLDPTPPRHARPRYSSQVQVELPAEWDDALSLLAAGDSLAGLLRRALREYAERAARRAA